MNKFNKKSIGVLAIVFMFGLVGVNIVSAATPSLGVAGTYGVLSSSYINTTTTTINGDVGFTTPPAVAPLGTHTNYGSGIPYDTAGIDQDNALSSLTSQDCTYTFPDTDIDLATDTTHGTIGIYTPGVYCTASTRAASIGTAGITLSGQGVFVFRINGALTTVTNSNVLSSDGASSCNIFWTPSAATTLGADTTFKGTIIDASGITVGANTSWDGRALAFGGTVTTDTNTITNTCEISAKPVVIKPRIISSGSIPMDFVNAVEVVSVPVVVPAVVEAVAVVATVPKLPKTGFPPQEVNSSWYSVLFSSVLNLFK